ncbi:MAG TPA: D-TA family PLP-dependent enzyme [Chitinophagaceae bacterium]|nr:D-TA family PLP-dependent enzyme [Chitinophagaceae bacterium]
MTAEDPKDWYFIDDIDSIDSPCLVIYRQRVLENIRTLLSMCDDIRRLRPHVKTHKTREIAELLLQSGIAKFKCATIAEAEMLALVDAPDVLLAYQPAGPKQKRFTELIKKYPATKFSCLVDNIVSARQLAAEATANNFIISVYIDVNVGMNRTGIEPGAPAIELYKQCKNIPGLNPVGLHVYDGHIRNKDFEQRTIECDRAFAPVIKMQEILIREGFPEPVIVAGGSPSFPIHVRRKKVECSPGTFIFWDYTYLTHCPEQHFIPAALVIARIISLPSENKICIDLGHKSIAAENEINRRVYFLNAPDLKFTGQSEEHLVADITPGHSYKVGDVLYGLPYHICPAVALYERALVIRDKRFASEWRIIARDRKITV